MQQRPTTTVVRDGIQSSVDFYNARYFSCTIFHRPDNRYVCKRRKRTGGKRVQQGRIPPILCIMPRSNGQRRWSGCKISRESSRRLDQTFATERWRVSRLESLRRHRREESGVGSRTKGNAGVG